MSRSVITNDKQLNLDFTALNVNADVLTKNLHEQSYVSNVISLSTFSKSRNFPEISSPVLERLLQQAEKIRW